MQRRLTLILSAVALASILLVGAGVLIMANVSARDEATSDVEATLQAISQLSVGSRRDIGQLSEALEGSRNAFSLTSLNVVLVIDGNVAQAPRRRIADGELQALIGTRLSPEQLEMFSANEPILTETDSAVLGLQRLSVDPRVVERDRIGNDGDVSLAVLVRRDITALPSGVLGWFLGSSAVVLAGAVLAGRMVARRFVQPISEIELTTAALAAGRLDARSPVTGSEELAHLAESVNTMAGQLELARDRDKQFLMSVSHDLRTPLTAISGYAEALVDQPYGSDGDHRSAEIGQVIGDHADRLERLVTDLLDLARLDSNQFTFNQAAVDLVVVTGRAVAGMEQLAVQANRSLKLVVDEALSDSHDRPGTVWADADRVTQIIDNLVGNALRFAKSDVEVEVSATPGFGHIKVSNDGQAISPDDLPHVFDRLYVGRAASDQGQANTGLGLAIVKELTEAMGGSVAATSTPTAGSTMPTSFVVSLPLASGRQAASNGVSDQLDKNLN